jgi:hypothetical protein
MLDETSDNNRMIWATSIASSIASIIGKFICHPLDTIKSKVQVNTIKLHNISSYPIGQAWELCK